MVNNDNVIKYIEKHAQMTIPIINIISKPGKAPAPLRKFTRFRCKTTLIVSVRASNKHSDNSVSQQHNTELQEYAKEYHSNSTPQFDSKVLRQQTQRNEIV